MVSGTLDQISVRWPVGTNRYAYKFAWGPTNWSAEVRLLPGSLSDWSAVECVKTWYDGRETHLMAVPRSGDAAPSEEVYSGDRPHLDRAVTGPLWFAYVAVPRLLDGIGTPLIVPAPWGPTTTNAALKGGTVNAACRPAPGAEPATDFSFYELEDPAADGSVALSRPARATVRLQRPTDEQTGIVAGATILYHAYDGQRRAFGPHLSYSFGLRTEAVEGPVSGLALAPEPARRRVVMDHRFGDITTNGPPVQYLATNTIRPTNDLPLRTMAIATVRRPTAAESDRATPTRIAFALALAAVVIIPPILLWKRTRTIETKSRQNP
jgi:hypothetical protein